MNSLDRIRSVATQIATPVYVLRAPIIAAVVGAVMLSMPSQALEIYRSLALGYQQSITQILLALGTLALAGTFIWYVGRNLTLRWQQEQLQRSGLASGLLRWMPRLIGATPIAASAVGLWRAAEGIPLIRVPQDYTTPVPGLLEEIAATRQQLEAAHSVLISGVAICAAMALILVGVTYVRSHHKSWKYAKPNPALFSIGTRSALTIVAFLAVVGLSAFFFTSPRELSRISGEIGALAIFNAFLICLTFFLGFLTNVYDRTEIPVLSGLVLIAIIASAFNLNDNHEIRTLDRETLTPMRDELAKQRYAEAEKLASRRIFLGASTAFERWLDSRPDRDFYLDRGLDYPVYVVAEQSGGLYAAHQTAMTLARLQDRCNAFAQHVFAISGVSGGGLGAALFSSLVRERQANTPKVQRPTCRVGEATENWYAAKSDAFLSQDFMAPLTAAGFFPDLFQRFLPFPIQRFDRARALEASFERAWDETVPDAWSNPFAESYYQSWEPEGVPPAVIINTTWVKTGDRAVFSPFHFYGQTSDRVQTILNLVRKPIALSTAVGVGARFPWVLPAASWQSEGRVVRRPSSKRTIARSRSTVEPSDRHFRFVDGGYFEYSGVETAIDIVRLIEDLKAKREREGGAPIRAKVYLVVLSDDESLEDALSSGNFGSKRAEVVDSSGFGEIMSPVTTLLNSRISRGSLSVTRAVDSQCPGCYRSRRDRRDLPGFDGDARVFRLNLTDFNITLGWQLSPATRRVIAAHSGEAHNCFAKPRGQRLRERPAWFTKIVNENNCAACRIVYDLSGRPQSQETGERRHPYDIDLPAGGRLLCRAE